MSERLYLNNILIDIYKNQIVRKIQIANIEEVTQLKSSFSYTFKLPRTSKNILFFDMLGTIGEESTKPYEEISVDYFYNEIALIQGGTAIIKKTEGNYFLNIIDGARSLSELLTGKKIADLPLDELNHILRTDLYVDSFDNTEGYIYCLANYGRGTPSTIIELDKQAPSIYTHTIFRRIFDSIGLTLQGDFFTTNAKYLNEVVTPTKGYLIENITETKLSRGGANTNTLTDNIVSGEFINIIKKFTFIDNGISDASIVDGNILFFTTSVHRLEFTIDYTTVSTYAKLEVQIDDISRAFIELPVGVLQTKNIILVLEVSAGSTLKLNLIVNSDLEQNPFEVDYEVQADMLLKKIVIGQLVRPVDYIGDMNQLDFIKDIINRYGLILHPVKATSNYKFKQFEELLNDFENTEDWSNKISSIDSENYYSGYAQINKFTYNYSEEITSKFLDAELLINNANAKVEKTMLQSSFEIPARGFLVRTYYTYNIFIWSEDDAGDPINEETPLKVMNIVKNDFATTMNVETFGGAPLQTIQNNVPFLTIPNSMQYIIDNYYNAFTELIQDYKEKIFFVKMSEIDIANLDFFKLKFLKQTGRYYYLNTIIHKPEGLSKISMIERFHN